MLKGICQSYFKPGTPLETMFQKSRAAGFEAFELCCNRPDGIGLTDATTEAEALAIAELAGRHGLKLPSVLFGGRSFGSRDAAEREQGNERLLRQIELAAALGADTILVVPGRVDAENHYDEVYARSQASLSRVIPSAEACRVHIAIENVWNQFLLSPLEFARYVDELNSPCAGAYFDVGNVLRIGFPEQWIRILGRRIRKVHLKDFRTSVNTMPGFVPLLSGDVNWAAVREALNEIGYNDALTAEMTPYGSEPDQALYDIARHIEVIVDGRPR